MTRIFSENNKRDIFLNADKRISITEGIEAVAQSTKSAVELQQGEAIFSPQRGVPTDRAVWSGTPNLPQFELFARKQILAKPEVKEVPNFDVEVNGELLSYTATIKTTFGEIEINGSL